VPAMNETPTIDDAAVREKPAGFLAWYHRVPLYLKIVVGMVLGVAVGLVVSKEWALRLNIPASIILRLLGASAPPLILVAVMAAVLRAADIAFDLVIIVLH